MDRITTCSTAVTERWAVAGAAGITGGIMAAGAMAGWNTASGATLVISGTASGASTALLAPAALAATADSAGMVDSAGMAEVVAGTAEVVAGTGDGDKDHLAQRIAHCANLGTTGENDRFWPVSLPLRPTGASEESHRPHLDAFAPRGVRRGGRILERGVADEA